MAVQTAGVQGEHRKDQKQAQHAKRENSGESGDGTSLGSRQGLAMAMHDGATNARKRYGFWLRAAIRAILAGSPESQNPEHDDTHEWIRYESAAHARTI